MKTLTSYMTLANRTNKDGELIESKPEVINALVTQLPDIIKAANGADRIKAAFVYGEKLRDTGLLPREQLHIDLEPLDKERLHALLGIVSEAGELCESIYSCIINNDPLDRDNLIEELGDVMWFIALFARSLDTDLENIVTINIEKLKVRYPEQFSDFQAVNRDLEGEKNAITQTA
ncbi:nucleoside triphosphate pyrophosphohydrolase family protein [Vibrio parahaemolyticus]|nr:nucleoside triphosphate pyrophosphohydrolase family protein [Vibrio parahaemolyticus]